MNNFNPVTEDNPNPDFNYPTSMKPIIFRNNHKKIIGTFFVASGPGPKPTVMLLHGFPGNEINFDIAHAVKRFGFNVIVFHYRGTWGSEGDFSISNSISDVNYAVEFFSKDAIAKQYNINSKKIILIGHSMGGFISFLTSFTNPKITNIGFLAGFNFGAFSEFLLKNPEFVEQTMDGLTQGSMLVNNTTAKAMFDEMLANKGDWNLLNKVSKMDKKNILLIGAEFDSVAPLNLHHFPLVESLKNCGATITEKIYKTGHSFSSTRIRLTTDIIEWLRELR